MNDKKIIHVLLHMFFYLEVEKNTQAKTRVEPTSAERYAQKTFVTWTESTYRFRRIIFWDGGNQAFELAANGHELFYFQEILNCFVTKSLEAEKVYRAGEGYTATLTDHKNKHYLGITVQGVHGEIYLTKHDCRVVTTHLGKLLQQVKLEELETIQYYD
jgi:hypothetical protein